MTVSSCGRQHVPRKPWGIEKLHAKTQNPDSKMAMLCSHAHSSSNARTVSSALLQKLPELTVHETQSSIYIAIHALARTPRCRKQAVRYVVSRVCCHVP